MNGEEDITEAAETSTKACRASKDCKEKCEGSRKGKTPEQKENIICCPRSHGNLVTPDTTCVVAETATIAPDGTRDTSLESDMAAPTQIVISKEDKKNKKYVKEEPSMIKIWNKFGAFLKTTATSLGCNLADLAAVLRAESGGAGFTEANSNRMTIRFENHVFWKYWGKCHAKQFDEHWNFRDPPGKGRYDHKVKGIMDGDDWFSCHVTPAQDSEWKVFNYARHLDEKAAIYATSFGAGQVLGSNYKKLGFEDPVDMFKAFSTSLKAQLDGFISYVKNTPKCINSLKATPVDFVKFASAYNGGDGKSYGKAIKKYRDAFISAMEKAGVTP
jgi:hypothetical protein